MKIIIEDPSDTILSFLMGLIIESSDCWICYLAYCVAYIQLEG